jgi:signal transduction histidine kinase/CheY-like chemotaxis protein
MALSIENSGKQVNPFKYYLLLNGFALLAIAANIINMIFYALDGMYTSAKVELLGIVVLIICVLANLKKYFTLSKALSLLIVNLQMLLLSYVQGISGGAYLYLFPYILSLIFFLNFSKRKTESVVTLSITVATMLAITFFAHYQSAIEPVDLLQSRPHYYLNIIITFLLTITFFVFALGLLRRREKKTRLEKKFKETIFNTSLDAIIIIDIATNSIIDCNSRAIEMFSLNWDEKSKLPEAEWKHLKDILYRQVPILQNKNTKNNYWQGDLLMTHEDGKHFYTLTNAVLFTHEEMQYCKINFLDITRQKQDELDVLLAKETAERALKVKSRFLSNMSHELRTPLNGIIGSANLITQQNEELAKNEYFNIIKISSGHMLNLVNQVLDYSKLETEKLELVNTSFNLADALKELIASFKWEAQTKDLKLLYEIDDEIPKIVTGDKLRVTQVLINIISNAIKFSETGTIKVIAKKIKEDSNTAAIYFEVSDNGIGVASGKEETIFDSFTQADIETTRKYGGTGLGLTISKKLVEKMGGELRVKNNVPKGSIFYFTVSFVKDNDSNYSIPEIIIKDLTGKRILLVEDNPVNMLVAKLMLKKWNAIVTEAANGKKGLELFNQQQFDILLVDLEMPEMDGSTLIKKIRQTNTLIPAIAFTAAAYENIFADLLQKGFNAFVPKPFVPQHLNNEIARLLELQVS